MKIATPSKAFYLNLVCIQLASLDAMAFRGIHGPRNRDDPDAERVRGRSGEPGPARDPRALLHHPDPVPRDRRPRPRRPPLGGEVVPRPPAMETSERSSEDTRPASRGDRKSTRLNS